MQAPWHPLMVHFPIAIWPLGVVFLCYAWLGKKAQWLAPGWVCLTIGFVMAVFAALTGQSDWARYAQNPHPLLDQHRDLGNALPWLMGAVLAARLHAYLIGRVRSAPAYDRLPIWACASLFVALLLLLTGFLGGSFVYSTLLLLVPSGAP